MTDSKMPEPVAWRYRDPGEDWRLSDDGPWMTYRKCKVDCEVQTLYTHPAPVADAELDDRLKAAGMLTIDQMMQPLSRFQIHAGISDLSAFEKWLERKAREYATLRAKYEVEDRDKGDDLYEWILAHSGAFHDVLVNFKAAICAHRARTAHHAGVITVQDAAKVLLDELSLRDIGQDHPQITPEMTIAASMFLSAILPEGGAHE